MLHLLKIEWLKLKNYRAFWIFVVFYLISIFFLNYLGFTTHQRTTHDMPASQILLGQPFDFPNVWGTVGWMSSWLLYFPGMMMIMLMTNEFNFKTHRQNIIDGVSRNQFLAVKLVLALLLAFVITILNVLTALYFGYKSGSSFSLDGSINIVYIFLQSILYIYFALMLAVLFRRSGVALIVFALYGLIFEWLACALLTFNFKVAPIGYFLPLQASDVLLPIPFGGKAFTLYPKAPSSTTLIITIFIYIILYVLIARKKFLKDDL